MFGLLDPGDGIDAAEWQSQCPRCNALVKQLTWASGVMLGVILGLYGGYFGGYIGVILGVILGGYRNPDD